MSYGQLHDNNYSLGRGELWFGRFTNNNFGTEGEFYIGNTPSVNLNLEQEMLEHFNSDFGIKEKDESITLQVTRTITFEAEDISVRNLGYFFFGDENVTNFTGATVTGFNLPNPRPGSGYGLSIEDGRPMGHGALDTANPPVLTQGANTLVEGDDYRVDYPRGYIEILPNPTATFTAGTDISVEYTYLDHTRSIVISSNQPVEGTLRFKAQYPVGEGYDYYMPWCKIGPNGDFALKGDDWQVIPFTVEVLKRPGWEAIYAAGRPYTP